MDVCNATSKQSGQQCRRAVTPGRSVCHYHGGSSPRGLAHPNTTHGRYSRDVPTRLISRYEQALADPELLSVRSDVAVLQALINEKLAKLEGSESQPAWERLQNQMVSFGATWKAEGRTDAERDADIGAMLETLQRGVGEAAILSEVRSLMQQRAKLAHQEHGRLVDLQQFMTVERAMLIAAALADVVKRHVGDQDTLRLIHADFVKALEGQRVERG